jgi:hypothetical protein
VCGVDRHHRSATLTLNNPIIHHFCHPLTHRKLPLPVANSFIENKKDSSTMPLSRSWKTHFLQGLAPLNAIGNRNVKKYSEAMTHNAAVDTKMKNLSKDHNFILIANNKKQVTILHNLKNYGGTILQPTNKEAALFGIDPDAQVVALDASAAIATQSKCTQSAANIIATENTGTISLCAL